MAAKASSLPHPTNDENDDQLLYIVLHSTVACIFRHGSRVMVKELSINAVEVFVATSSKRNHRILRQLLAMLETIMKQVNSFFVSVLDMAEAAFLRHNANQRYRVQ